MTLLEVNELSVRFRGESGGVQAVDGVSFALERGETLAIVGESGCGKSATAMSLLGLLPEAGQITGGEVWLDGVDLCQLPDKALRKIRGKDAAVIFQDPMTSLNPAFTVGRQVGEVLRRHQGMSRREARDRSRELLEIVGIPAPASRLDEFPHQLSGGMRQRVMIAMAVACDPKVLIADEPTTALDVTIQAGILDVLARLQDRLGTAIVLITHDLGVVADIADRVVVMYAGRKVEEASADQLFHNPQHPYTRGMLRAVPNPYIGTPNQRPSRLEEIPGIVPTISEPVDVCLFAPRCPRATAECRTHKPPLVADLSGHQAACFHPGSTATDAARSNVPPTGKGSLT